MTAVKPPGTGSGLARRVPANAAWFGTTVWSHQLSTPDTVLFGSAFGRSCRRLAARYSSYQYGTAMITPTIHSTSATSPYGPTTVATSSHTLPSTVRFIAGFWPRRRALTSVVPAAISTAVPLSSSPRPVTSATTAVAWITASHTTGRAYGGDRKSRRLNSS